MIGGFLLLLLAISIWYMNYYPSTEDSYINANVAHIAAQITAPAIAVYAEDYQSVKKDQLLAELDSRAFEIAVKKAEANLQAAEQDVRALSASVEVAKAQMEKAQAEYMVQVRNVPRILALVKGGKASRAEGVKAQGALESAKAAYESAQQNYVETQQQLGATIASNPKILLARANLAEALLNLSYTKIKAPSAGQLIHFNLRPGTLVTTGQLLFSFIEDKDWWVDANFKETDLKHIRIGQSATISIDTYPGIAFYGKVSGISPGSGAAFSILPPENATGNWVKVTQRFTVRVQILNPDPHYPLRVGASAKVRIDTIQ